MSSFLKLETFDTAAVTSDQVAMSLSDFEEAKLTSFETGYEAGWEDAVAAQNVEVARLREDLGRNLHTLSFTYHEARGHILHALEPLLHDMVSKVLPSIAKETLGRIVMEQLLPVAESMASAPITVMANPESLPQIRDLLTTQDSLPFVFSAEASLGEGQVYLRMTDTETRIDLDGVIKAIGAAVQTFFHIGNEEKEHG